METESEAWVIDPLYRRIRLFINVQSSEAQPYDQTAGRCVAPLRCKHFADDEHKVFR